MKKILDLEELNKIKFFIENQRKSIDKYLKDVKDDLSEMPDAQFVQSVCDGNIVEGSVYECDFKNMNYFSEVNEGKDIIISDYESRCKKATLKRLLKEKDALVDVCIPEGSEWVKFAVTCPLAGSDACKLKNFRWVKNSGDREKKDWKKDYDL